MERPLDEQLIDVGGLMLNVALGPSTGPPLLLLHGGCANWRVWSAVAEALSTDWQVTAPDLRGHGRSGRGSRYRIADYADDIAALIALTLAQPGVIVGHSLGGLVAIAVAAGRPELVRAIVLGDAPLDLAFLRRHIGANRARNDAWRALAASGATLSELIARLPDVPTPLPGGEIGRIRDVVPEGSAWYEEMATSLARLDPAMLDAVIEFEDMHQGLDELMPRVSCPVLFVQGDPAVGGLLADGEVERWFTSSRGDLRSMLAGVGHGLFMEAPDRFIEAIQPFLRAFRAAGGAAPY